MYGPACFPLAHFDQLPRTEFGEYLRDIITLFERDVPFTPMVCIPSFTLRKIAQSFSTSALTSLAHNEASRKNIFPLEEHFFALFQRSQLPKFFTQELHHAYTRYLLQGFVSVFPSTTALRPTTMPENVAGDANVLESVLKVWAQNAATYIARKPGCSILEALSQTGIIIQYQPQADISGIGYTQDAITGNKTQVQIAAMHGVATPQDSFDVDTWWVDVRTLNIVSSRHNPQSQRFTRILDGLHPAPMEESLAPTLTESQIISIAQQVIQCKRQFLEHKVVHWSLENNHLVCTGIDPHVFSPQSNTTFVSIAKLFIIPSGVTRSVGTHHQGYYFSGSQMLNSTAHQFRKNTLAIMSTTVAREIAAILPKRKAESLQRTVIYEPFSDSVETSVDSASQLIQEFESIYEYLQDLNIRIELVLPNLFSATDAILLTDALQKKSKVSALDFDVSLKIATPHSLMQLKEYPLQRFTSVYFDVYAFHAYHLGFNHSSPELLDRYPLDAQYCGEMLEHVHKIISTANQLRVTSKKIQKFLLLSGSYHDDMVRHALHQSYEGIVVQEKVAHLAKACIIDVEGSPWQK